MRHDFSPSSMSQSPQSSDGTPVHGGDRRRWFLVVSALIATKLWLASGLTVTAYATASHDDRLYLLTANRILNGAWLGRPYGNMTLAKGPFYSVFVLVSWALGLPLLFAEQFSTWPPRALHLGDSPMDFVAFRPDCAVRVLLFNPLTWHLSRYAVVREGIYPALALIVLACTAGLLSRLDRSRREVSAGRLLWAQSGGFLAHP
jgi:hypothetical protein